MALLNGRQKSKFVFFRNRPSFVLGSSCWGASNGLLEIVDFSHLGMLMISWDELTWLGFRMDECSTSLRVQLIQQG